MKIADKNFEISISEYEISDRIKQLAAKLNTDYFEKNPLLIVILNGSFIFASDLVRELNIPLEVSFVKLQSYEDTKSSGKVRSLIGLDEEVAGRDLIIIEDIVDTGTTINYIMDYVKPQNPASVTIASMLHKPQATQIPLDIDYVGFKIPDVFVVGYGLDYNGKGRNLKSIYKLKEAE